MTKKAHVWGEVSQSSVTIEEGPPISVAFPDKASRQVIVFTKICADCGEEASSYDTSDKWTCSFRTCTDHWVVYPKPDPSPP